MESRETSSETEPLVKVTTVQFSNKTKISYRQYLLEFVFFFYFTNYLLADMVGYQYMYHYASELLNYNSDNFTQNASVCDVNKSSPGYQLQQEVGSYASSWQLYFALASGIPGLFSGVVYGTYSDKLGRKFIMLLSTLLVACRSAAYLVAIELKLSLEYVIIGYLLEGIGGSFNTMLLAGAAYTADVTQAGKSRSLRLLIVFTVAGLSEGVAYVAYGYAISGLGFRNTFLIVLGTNVFTVAGIIFLPESRSGKHMEHMTFRQYIYRAFRFYTEGSKTNPNRYIYILCGGSLFFVVIGTIQRSGIEVLYLSDSPFCWDSVQIGNFEAIGHTGQRVLSLAALVVLLRCTTEELTSIICSVVLVVSFILEAFAKTNMMMYAVTVLSLSYTPLMLLIKTMASSKTDVDQQGALFASLQVVDSFCNTAGTVLLNLVYQLTVTLMQGAVFLYSGALCVICTALLVILQVMMKRNVDKEMSTVN